MSAYLDASFLVALYTPDANRLSAASTVANFSSPLWVSTLCEFEAVNAFQLRVFRGDASPQEALRSALELDRDLDDGVLLRRSVSETAYTRAHSLSNQFTAVIGVRGADVAHVAFAIELGAADFFSFDFRQRQLAVAVGLRLNHAP